MNFIPSSDTRELVVFDLDNCLSNDEWRLPHIDFSHGRIDARWEKYHALGVGDNAAHRDMFDYEVKARGRLPIFITMRPVKFRTATADWLARWFDVKEPILLMRAEGDVRGSVELKREAVLSLPRPPVQAYDDREDIVRMYRELGIPATVLRIHSLPADRPLAGREGDGPMPIAPPTRGEGPPRTPIAPPPAPKRAGDYLAEAAETFRAKNAEYGDDYRAFGAVAAAMFPGGLRVRSAEEWNRLAVFIWALSKMGRYAKNMEDGGHADSALDLSVYGAMLREMTE